MLEQNDLVQKLLLYQKVEIDIFFKNLETRKIEELIDKILEIKVNNKSIYFSGVGKSLNMAKHTADMLRSLGVSAHLLHPLEALHGDLGTLNPDDLVILYSKSGKTKELEELAFFLNKMKINIIGVFCDPSSLEGNIAKFTNIIIILPCGKELDNDFDLVPTVSILCYLMFCNLLVGGILKKTQMNIEEYGIHHPSGNIGQKVWLTVKDIMLNINEICQISSKSTLIDAMDAMIGSRSGYCLIIQDKKLCGMISDGDIRRYMKLAYQKKENINFEMEIKHLMTHNPTTISENFKISDMIEVINKNKSLSIGIPVKNSLNELIGFIDSKTLLKYCHLF